MCKSLENGNRLRRKGHGVEEALRKKLGVAPGK